MRFTLIKLMRAGLLLACGVILFLSSMVGGQVPDQRKNVLILYWDNKDIPGNVSFEQGFLSGMRAEARDNWEVYNEYLDSARFPGEHQYQILYDYLRQKYAAHSIDVVVATPDPALDFLLMHRADLFPNCPIVFVGVKRPPPNVLAAGAGLTGIIRANTHRKTLDLALTLHPDVKQVFVVSGTPELDKRFEIIARQELSSYEHRVSFTYLTDLSLNELIATTSSLPKQSLILYVWQRFSTGDEKYLQTHEILERIARSASAPIYGMGSRNVGYGLVGGYVQDSEQNGTEVAEIVRRILNGTRARDIPVDSAPSVLMFDWRQLQRWRISENKLPNNSIIKFKELTFWQQYKWRIMLVVALFTLQTSLIAFLLIERKRRQRAREALDSLNAELEQRIASRTSALNAKTRELETFAYSVAHDLKAPLRGIDGYSRLLLEDHLDTLNDEGRGFLHTIQNSTCEMSQLIDELLEYSRLERREFRSDQVELGPLITTIVEQKKREATATSIDFVLKVNGGSVSADPNGLTQSLRNYLDNAVKFTRKVSQPRIEIGSKELSEKVLVWVRDNGVGFDMKYHDRMFDIFQRLNPSEQYPGTGVGLAIVRKAMERMGGKAWAQSKPGQGATFYLEIPKQPGSLIDERQSQSNLNS
jgi:signal transduction histidine kinase